MPRVLLPFVYRVDHVPPRRRKPQVELAVGTHDFELRTVDLSRTRIAAQWTERRGKALRRPMACRVFEGLLYMPIWGEYDQLCARHVLGLQERRARLGFEVEPVTHVLGYTPKTDEHNLVSLHLGSPQFHRGPPRSGTLLHSSEQSDRERMQDICSRLVLFDDEVWREVKSPRILLITKRGTGQTLIEADHRSFAPMPDAREPLGFRRMALTEFSRLRDHAPDIEIDTQFDDLTVFEPQALAFDGYVDFLRNLASNAANSAGPTLGDLPASAIRHVLTLRRFARPSESEPCDRTSAEDAIRAFLQFGLWKGGVKDWVRSALAAYGHP